MKGILAVLGFALAWGLGPTIYASEISVERGRLISIVGGCHDCHTEGYSQSQGKIDPAAALTGSSSIGFKGPWGTTYAQNLRLLVASLNEDGYVRYMRNLTTAPPMPWWNVRVMEEEDLRSLYRYIKSLGAPGRPAPAIVSADQEPKTPYIVLDPPHAAKPCESDFECGVGQICQAAGSVAAKCVRR